MGPSCPITTHTKYLLMEKSVDYVASNALYLQGIASPDPLPGNSDTITLMNTFDTHINTWIKPAKFDCERVILYYA